MGSARKSLGIQVQYVQLDTYSSLGLLNSGAGRACHGRGPCTWARRNGLRWLDDDSMRTTIHCTDVLACRRDVLVQWV